MVKIITDNTTPSIDIDVDTPTPASVSVNTGTIRTSSIGTEPLYGPKGDTGPQGIQGIQGPQGIQGEKGNTGDAFAIYKTYSSIASMNADKNNVPEGKFVLIASTVEDEDNAKLYVKGASDFSFLTDMSGAKGLKGETGNTGATGQDGVSVTGVSLISTSGLNNTYRMTFSNNTYFDYVVRDGASGSTQWGGITGTLSNQTDLNNELNDLQSQIDAIVSSSDVFDIVGTYAELQAYDISTVPVNDIIKVLVDSTHSNAATYYRCTESGGVKSWTYIGSEGAYYTKSEADGRFVSQTTTVNGQALSSNITLDAQDVGALPNSTVIPTATSDLTNDSGYITGIDSTDVTNALGYTPVNPSNLSTVATSGNYNDLSNKPTIPAAQVQSDWNQSNTSAVDYIKNKPTIPPGVVVDQTYNPNSANAQSGVAIAGAGFITLSDVPTEIFIATYGTTTFAEIQTAYNAGKIILCKYNTDDIYTLSSISQTYANFSRTSGFYCYEITCDMSNHWLQSGGQAQKSSNLVTSVSSSSTDTQYPSAKCVYDEFADSVKYAASGNFYCWYSQGATPEKLYTTTDILSAGIPIFKADGTYYDRNTYVGDSFLYPTFRAGAYSRQQSDDIIPFRVDLTDINSNSLNIKQVDGQWCYYEQSLSTSNINVGTYDLSSIIQGYLPNDGYSYEVKIFVQYASKNTTASLISFNDCMFFWGDAYGTGNTECKSAIDSIIIKPDRALSMKIENGKPADLTVTALGYRRLGINA